MQTQTLEIPREALRFDAGPVRFAASAEAGTREYEIQMLIRSAEAIVNWYWGRIIHDMSGMTVRKDALPIDWCHDYNTILGVADQFKADEKTGLSGHGKLVSIADDDRANEVIQKGTRGVPYECSLDWSGPARIEWVDEGMTVQVNGRDFAGPGYVVREWNFQGVAICPHGADGGTQAQFSAAESTGRVPVTLFSQSRIPMPPTTAPGQGAAGQQQTNAPAVPAQQQAAAPAAGGAAVEITISGNDPAAQFRADLKKFTDRFGTENGTKWFTEGLNFGDALEKHSEALQQQLTSEKAKVGALEQKLSAAPRGEAAPVPTGSNEPAPAGQNQPAAKFAHLGKNLQRFASGIKLPQ
jgi:hypothetical protein